MCQRFFVLVAVVLVTMAVSGVADAQGRYTADRNVAPAPIVSETAILTPIPDRNSDTGFSTETGPGSMPTTPAPVVIEAGEAESDCSGCQSGCCDCGYCSPNQYCCPGELCGSACGSLSRFLLGSSQNYGGPCNSPYLFHKGQFTVESWLDQGFTWNSANPGNQSNLPVTFNDRANEYQMNQLYLAMERKVNLRKRWDWGARVDLFYGTDYIYTQAVGLETKDDGSNRWNGTGPRESLNSPGGVAMYGLSMPQLYAEFLTPLGYGTTIKAGHFYSIMGHESVMATENFFYSHSYTKQYAEPFTHTGILLDYSLRPNWSLKAGLVRGWDAWEDPISMNSTERRFGFLGGIGWKSCDNRTAIDFNVYSGNEQFDFVDAEMQNRTNYSLVIERKISPRLTYVFQHDLGVQQNGTFRFDEQFNVQQASAEWYTIVNYLYYKVSEDTSFGCRLEWFNDPQLSRVLQLAPTNGSTGGNYYEATVGMNWKPFNRCVIRPELRWDWSDVTPFAATGAYNEFSDKNQFTLGVDVLYRF